jgi:hypothetical protein
MQFTIHPNIYNTSPHSKGLLHMLEQAWIRDKQLGDGSMFIVSGFANYNGGVRFYDTIKNHIAKGGQCFALFGGSTSQRLSSSQVVEQLLTIGCRVYLLNRKRILHAKCYGFQGKKGQSLVISSGNFTGPGMSQNVEASLLIEEPFVSQLGFEWHKMFDSLLKQKWDIYSPKLEERAAPAWKLLYDEIGGSVLLEDEQEVTMLITLGAHDTARIQAKPGDPAGLGTQYFWLSKDSYDFFPALTIKNERGYKATYSALINMLYVDLELEETVRVTFEAENNLDFRLGTGALKFSKIAKGGDLAAITRLTEFNYELRVFAIGSKEYEKFLPYATNFIGHRGKKYGYVGNVEFFKILS